MLPQVHASFESSLVVERIALEHGIAHSCRVYGKADDAVTAVVKVELQRLGWCGLAISRRFFLVGRLLAFGILLFVLSCQRLSFSLFLRLFAHHLLLFRHAEAVVGINVEEHHVIVGLGSPASMTAIAGTVALEEHRLTA